MSTLTVGVVQAHTLPTRSETLSELERLVLLAKEEEKPGGVHLLLFPECYVGGYPRTCSFGAAVGARTDRGRDQFLQHYKDACDLGGEHGQSAGDGTRETLERISRESGVFLAVGLVEKDGGTLYCSVAYVCPQNGLVGKRRKLMPTSAERMAWGFGKTESLKAVKANLNGVEVTLAAAICWENYMPLLRYTIYSQNVSIYLAPTADARPTWLSAMQMIAQEGRTYVLSANQACLHKELPNYVTTETEQPAATASDEADTFACRGGSCIIDPFGKVLAGPLWETNPKVLCATIDMDEVIRGKFDLDVVGSYSRPEFKFSVDGLDLNAPVTEYQQSSFRRRTAYQGAHEST